MWKLKCGCVRDFQEGQNKLKVELEEILLFFKNMLYAVLSSPKPQRRIITQLTVLILILDALLLLEEAPLIPGRVTRPDTTRFNESESESFKFFNPEAIKLN